MPTNLINNQIILFAGDSITDCGRRADFYPRGNGYVKFFHELLSIREPKKRVTIINQGISGNTVADLEARWTDDVLRARPDWLSILIGINDLDRTIRNVATAVPPGLYAEKYDQLLCRTRAALPQCRFILIEPFYISTEDNPASQRHQVLKLLPEYVKTVHRLSRQYKTRLVRMHAEFQKMIQTQPVDFFCPEPIHPNPAGHLAIADKIYEALS